MRRAGLAGGAVSVQLSGVAGTVQHHAFHHLAHLGRCHFRDHTMRPVGKRVRQLTRRMKRRRPQIRVAAQLFGTLEHDMRRQIDTAVGDGRGHAHELDRRHRNFLAHGD